MASALVAGLSASACIDPTGKYEDFLERAYMPSDAGPVDTTCPSLDGMELPEPAQLSGSYYYVVSLPPYEKQPTIYVLEAEATREGDVYTIRMRDRPLKFADRKTSGRRVQRVAHHDRIGRRAATSSPTW